MSDTSHSVSSSLYELVDIQDSDHSWLVELHNDPLVLRNLTDPVPITYEDHVLWWSSLNRHREVRKVFTVDGQRAGLCKFYQIDRMNQNCVLGADLHRDFRGRGLSYHMWEQMLAFCFDELKLHRVSLTTAEYNFASKIYAKLGFLEEGRLVKSLFRDGQFHDQIAMYMLRDDYTRKYGKA